MVAQTNSCNMHGISEKFQPVSGAGIGFFKSPRRQFYDRITFPSPPGKAPGFQGGNTFDSFSFFVNKDDIYCHEHEKTVYGVTLFKKQSIISGRKSFFPHQPHQTAPKTFSFGKTAGKETFAGGGGAGVSITPIAFIAVCGGNVKMLQIYKDNNSIDKAISMIPDLFDRVKGLFDKKEPELPEV